MLIIKVGGGKTINWDYLASDIKNLKEKVIIVHGANAYMKEISEKLGISEKIITSPSGHTSRFTDQKVVDVLTMVYSGLVNKNIVAALQGHGINAIGLTGADGKIWLGKRKTVILSKEGNKIKIIRNCLTGNVESINIQLLRLLIRSGYIPVLTIPAITKEGELINVDNDRAVSVMAKDLQVKKLIMLFEAPGLLENPQDESSRIKFIDKKDIDKYIKNTSGRMRKKLLGVKEAFSFGVETVYFGDGRIVNPIAKTLAGKGTVIS